MQARRSLKALTASTGASSPALNFLLPLCSSPNVGIKTLKELMGKSDKWQLLTIHSIYKAAIPKTNNYKKDKEKKCELTNTATKQHKPSAPIYTGNYSGSAVIYIIHWNLFFTYCSSPLLARFFGYVRWVMKNCNQTQVLSPTLTQESVGA